MTEIHDIFEKMAGTWELRRAIQEGPPPVQNFHAVGTAKFTPAGKNILNYREEGTLEKLKDQQTSTFYRDYQYQLKDDVIIVLHGSGPQQGQEYQRYRLAADDMTLLSDEEHICGDDIYNGKYEWLNDNKFTLTTIAKGPRKGLIITTHFQRLSDTHIIA